MTLLCKRMEESTKESSKIHKPQVYKNKEKHMAQTPKQTEKDVRKLAGKAGGNPKSGEEMQIFQQGQNQLLGIQAQQQALLREQAMRQQMRSRENSTLSQAAELGVQSAVASAAGNQLGAQVATMNPATQQILQKYGAKPSVQVQRRSTTQTTPGKVQITNNNITTTKNDIKISSPNIPMKTVATGAAGIGAGAAVGATVGKFKTWLSNVFAKQREEDQARNKEYQRKEWSLSHSASRMMRGLEKLGKTFADRLDPRKLNRGGMSTIKMLSYLGLMVTIAENWPKILSFADTAEKWFNKAADFFGFNGWENSGLRQGILTALGARQGETIPEAAFKYFFDKGDQQGNRKGIVTYFVDKLKLFFQERSEAVSKLSSLSFPSTGTGVIDALLPALSGLGDYIKNIFAVLLNGKSALAAITAKQAQKNSVESSMGDRYKLNGTPDNDNPNWNKNAHRYYNYYEGENGEKITVGDLSTFRSKNERQDWINSGDIDSRGVFLNNVGSSTRLANSMINDLNDKKNTNIVLGKLSTLQANASIYKDEFGNGIAVPTDFVEAVEDRFGLDHEDIGHKVKCKVIKTTLADSEKFNENYSWSAGERLSNLIPEWYDFLTLGSTYIGKQFGYAAVNADRMADFKERDSRSVYKVVPWDAPGAPVTFENWNGGKQALDVTFLTESDFENLYDRISAKVGYSQSDSDPYKKKFTLADTDFLQKIIEADTKRESEKAVSTATKTYSDPNNRDRTGNTHITKETLDENELKNILRKANPEKYFDKIEDKRGANSYEEYIDILTRERKAAWDNMEKTERDHPISVKAMEGSPNYETRVYKVKDKDGKENIYALPIKKEFIEVSSEVGELDEETLLKELSSPERERSYNAIKEQLKKSRGINSFEEYVKYEFDKTKEIWENLTDEEKKTHLGTGVNAVGKTGYVDYENLGNGIERRTYSIEGEKRSYTIPVKTSTAETLETLQENAEKEAEVGVRNRVVQQEQQAAAHAGITNALIQNSASSSLPEIETTSFVRNFNTETLDDLRNEIATSGGYSGYLVDEKKFDPNYDNVELTEEYIKSKVGDLEPGKYAISYLRYGDNFKNFQEQYGITGAKHAYERGKELYNSLKEQYIKERQEEISQNISDVEKLYNEAITYGSNNPLTNQWTGTTRDGKTVTIDFGKYSTVDKETRVNGAVKPEGATLSFDDIGTTRPIIGAKNIFGDLFGSSIPEGIGVSNAMVQKIVEFEVGAGKRYGYNISEEGLKGKDNKDASGHKTFGYGLLMHPIEGKYMDEVKDEYTQEELQGLFLNHIRNSSIEVDNWAKANNVSLTQAQKDAMVSAVYNFGSSFLQKPIATKIAQNPNDPSIIEDWKHLSDDKKSTHPGLIPRREDEANWYSGGSNSSPAVTATVPNDRGSRVDTSKNAADSVQWVMDNVVNKNNIYADGKNGHAKGGFKKVDDDTIMADCSGMTCEAYKSIGVNISSGTAGQIKEGEWVDEGGVRLDGTVTNKNATPNEENLQPGDLLFYRPSDAKIEEDTAKGDNGRGLKSRDYNVGHVEYYLGNGKKVGTGKDGKRVVTDISNTGGQIYIGAKRYVGDVESNLQYAAGDNLSSSGGFSFGNMIGSGKEMLSSLWSDLTGAVSGIFDTIMGAFDSLADFNDEEESYKWERIENPEVTLKNLADKSGRLGGFTKEDMYSPNFASLLSSIDDENVYNIIWKKDQPGKFYLEKRKKRPSEKELFASEEKALFDTSSEEKIKEEENIVENSVNDTVDSTNESSKEEENNWETVDYRFIISRLNRILNSDFRDAFLEEFGDKVRESPELMAQALTKYDPDGYDYVASFDPEKGVIYKRIKKKNKFLEWIQTQTPWLEKIQQDIKEKYGVLPTSFEKIDDEALENPTEDVLDTANNVFASESEREKSTDVTKSAALKITSAFEKWAHITLKGMDAVYSKTPTINNSVTNNSPQASDSLTDLFNKY